jgi:hypothetical protein
MTRKQISHSAGELPLKLTAAQRKLVLEGLTCLDQEIEQIIKDTPTGRPVMLTLDGLDNLGIYVAAEANHCPDKPKARKLEAIFNKIQSLLDKFTDEPPPRSAVVPPESTRKPRRRATATDVVYQFKITLLGSNPPIWRRIQVQDCTLDKLHEHIQTAMGWLNGHLHQFDIKGRCYGDPDLLDDGFDEFDGADSTKTLLSRILPKTGQRFAFRYEYDFGDSWEHEVMFEGSPALDPKARYPLCLEGARACPPEDCGGIWAYGELLKAIRNPRHKEHESLLEWVGGRFDSEQFDPKKATKAMKKGLPDWRAMDEGF